MRSKTFQFWDRYLVSLLLDYVAAGRDSKVDLHTETFAEMLVYDFVCNHHNYARWGTVYVAEMYILQEEHPAEKYFSGVWSDMEIEHSINRDCVTIGGLTAIKQTKLQWIAGILQHT